MTLTLTHHRFSVADYERMIDEGILGENDRVELIHGEILEKMSIGDLHAACVNKLTRLWNRLLVDSAIVAVQNPVRLEDSRPEPDIALLRPREDFYAGGAPEAADVLLLIEVADTSLEFDRDIKGPLYAAAGIAEYWILDLENRVLLRHRLPRSGAYADVEPFSSDQEIRLDLLPDLLVRVEHLLP